MFYVYILLCSDNSYYIGHTCDLTRRIGKRNEGTAARHTRERRPVRLVYFEEVPHRPAGMRREAQLKRWSRAKKEALIRGDLATFRRISKRTRLGD
jgi:tRNA/rRNA methyltransferase